MSNADVDIDDVEVALTALTVFHTSDASHSAVSLSSSASPAHAHAHLAPTDRAAKAEFEVRSEEELGEEEMLGGSVRPSLFARLRRWLLHSSRNPSYLPLSSNSASPPPLKHSSTRPIHTILLSLLLLVACLIAILLFARAPLYPAAPNGSDAVSQLTAAAAHAALSHPPSPSRWSNLTHLILVAGHAVLTTTDLSNVHSPDAWLLLEYQRGQVSTYIDHIRQGVTMARDDPHSLLIFSGGQTRQQAGPRSEGLSYWMVAEHEQWFINDGVSKQTGPGSDQQPLSSSDSASIAADIADVRDRSLTEEYARDSFENLLFSFARFREVTGSYPDRVSVIGFSFKSPRFTMLHRSALRFDESKFHYIGIDPPDEQLIQANGNSNNVTQAAPPSPTSENGDPSENVPPASSSAAAFIRARAALLASEQSKSFIPFLSDPYSCRADGVLLSKKHGRNPFRRSHLGYLFGAPEMAPLLTWCHHDIYPGPLPWDPERVQLAKSREILERERRNMGWT